MLVRRWLIFCLGVVMLAFGAVLNTQLHLGVSSVGILPLVLSQISSATLGQMTIAFYLLLVLAQLLLVKQLRLKILLQIPFSFVFGLIVDGVNRLLRVGEQPFIITFLLLLIAMLIISFGVYLMISTDLVLNPADGIVQTIADVIGSDFGKVKLVLDVVLVAVALIISWIFSGRLIGFGIGTILPGIIIGQLISSHKKWFDTRLQDWIRQ